MPSSQNTPLSKIQDLVGAAITTTPTPGIALQGGRGAQWNRFLWTYAPGSGTSIAFVDIEVQAAISAAGPWFAIDSINDADTTDVANTHAFPTSGAIAAGSVVVDGSYPFFRVLASADAAGVAGDEIVVYTQARF